jgi:hypothetical protein
LCFSCASPPPPLSASTPLPAPALSLLCPSSLSAPSTLWTPPSPLWVLPWVCWWCAPPPPLICTTQPASTPSCTPCAFPWPPRTSYQIFLRFPSALGVLLLLWDLWLVYYQPKIRFSLLPVAFSGRIACFGLSCGATGSGQIWHRGNLTPSFHLKLFQASRTTSWCLNRDFSSIFAQLYSPSSSNSSSGSEDIPPRVSRPPLSIWSGSLPLRRRLGCQIAIFR